MLQMKDGDMIKLKFSDGCYKPYEYEKWAQADKRLMTGYHPEIGVYWDRIAQASEDVHQHF